MFLAELARFDNSQNVKMKTSDQIEPILFLGGDGSAEESAKTEKAVVFVQRDRGRGPWWRRRARGPCSRSWRNLHVLIILKTSK